MLRTVTAAAGTHLVSPRLRKPELRLLDGIVPLAELSNGNGEAGIRGRNSELATRFLAPGKTGVKAHRNQALSNGLGHLINGFPGIAVP